MAATRRSGRLLHASGGKRVCLDHLTTRRRRRQRAEGTSGGGNVTTIPRLLLGFTGRTDRVLFSTRGRWGGRRKNVNASTSLSVSRPLPILVEDANTGRLFLNLVAANQKTQVLGEENKNTDRHNKGRTHTPNGRLTPRLCTDRRSTRKFPRECVDEGENLHLLLTLCRPRPQLKICGFGGPIQREPRPTDSVKEKGRRLRPNDDLNEPLLEPLVRDRKRVEQDVPWSTD